MRTELTAAFCESALDNLTLRLLGGVGLLDPLDWLGGGVGM